MSKQQTVTDEEREGGGFTKGVVGGISYLCQKSKFGGFVYFSVIHATNAFSDCQTRTHTHPEI